MASGKIKIKPGDTVIFNPAESSSLAVYKGSDAIVKNVDGTRILIELKEHNVMIHTDEKCLKKR